MTDNPRIVSDPKVCGGDPCVTGARIAAHVVLSHLAAGDSWEDLLIQFPKLSKEDVRACLVYAAYLATEKSVPA